MEKRSQMTTKKIGIIGGGQLAWMMAAEAKQLDLEVFIQTPSINDPAVNLAANYILAKIDDAIATKELAKLCDVITFENEFIDLEELKKLAASGVIFHPSLASLSPLLDKYEQRCYCQQHGLPTPQFTDITLTENLTPPFGFPAVLKARRFGYDGYGTFILKDRQELEDICKRFQGVEMLIEEFIHFERELAVIGARSLTGEIKIYPVVETKQKDRVCRWTIAPANITETVNLEAESIVRQLLQKLEYVGVFGVELFLTKEGKILVNEIAPRTHNSGHYTLNGCQTSQFAQQLLAVAGLPLGSTAFVAEGAVMVNLLGYENSVSDYGEKRNKLAVIDNASVFWYGKNEARIGRKLGHVTVLLQEGKLDKAWEIIETIEAIWY
jgi:5-(carboxyamino)imidazole ribonucleotide synthase